MLKNKRGLETGESGVWTAVAAILTLAIFWFIGSIFFVQNALGAVGDANQGQQLDTLLAGIVKVCGNTDHPEVKDLIVTVLGKHQIVYKRGPPAFGSARNKNVLAAGCKLNCLCAFNGDEVAQCIPMYSQQSVSCQDIETEEIIDWAPDLTHIELPSTYYGKEEFNCKYRLNLKWKQPNTVVVTIAEAQPITYTDSGTWDYALTWTSSPWRC